MLIFTFIVIFVVTVAVVYIFLVMPRVGGADMDLQSTDYAHRGLWSPSVPENSLAAFREAKLEGYGIELDVRVSADGVPVVFHDASLMRMCGKRQMLSSLRAAELCALSLKGTEEYIPTLSQVLSLVEGHVPLLIEIKGTVLDSATRRLCQALCEILDGYGGAFAIQSFSPKILAYFKKYRPRYARGQLVAKMTKQSSAGLNALIRFALTHMLTNVISRPDFVAVDGRLINEPAFLLATKLFSARGFVWTVRREEQYALCRRRSLYAVFEKIKP